MMNGLWTEETKNLALDVSNGNMGALRVINELLHFTKWFEMMKWCKDNLTGAELWIKYKDEFNCDNNNLGKWIQEQIEKDNKAGKYYYDDILKDIDLRIM